MKTLQNALFSFFVCILIAASAFTPAQAMKSPLQTYTYNPVAEEYLKSELIAKGIADFAVAFPVESERVIRAEFLLALLTDSSLQNAPYIKIYNVVIDGDVKGDGKNLPFNLVFDGCTFTGRIEFSGAHIRSFNMYNSKVAGSVRLGRAFIAEDLSLYSSTYESAVTMFGANIGGNFFASNSQFNGTQPDPDIAFPFELWTTRVAKSVEFRGATFKGDAMFESARIGENLILNGSIFEKNAKFKDIRVSNVVEAKETVFIGPVTFESGIVNRDAYFTSASFNGEASFDFFRVERFFEFDQAVFNDKTSFKYTEAGWGNFSQSTFNAGTEFAGVSIENNLNFTGAMYSHKPEPFSFHDSQVNGSAIFEHFTAPAGISLTDNWFGGLQISGLDKPFDLIDFSGSTIDGGLSISFITAEILQATGVDAGNIAKFEQVRVNHWLDMSNATFGYFLIHEFHGPADSASFNLRGLQYGDIGLSGQELTDDNWRFLLDLLDKSVYSPQAYIALSQLLLDKGHPDWAGEVEVTMRVRERDQILAPYSASWFWSWFMFLFSGYGYRPILAFVWSFLVIGAGAYVFRDEETLTLVEAEKPAPVYSALLYSFDLFLPYIELGIRELWVPKSENKRMWDYRHIHQLLGWILTPIALLTFGGIL